MASLTNTLDRSEVEATTAAFEKLRAAIEAVNAELTKLGDKAHGGITINAVGSLVQIDIKPAVAAGFDRAFEQYRTRRA